MRQVGKCLVLCSEPLIITLQRKERLQKGVGIVCRWHACRAGALIGDTILLIRSIRGLNQGEIHIEEQVQEIMNGAQGFEQKDCLIRWTRGRSTMVVINGRINITALLRLMTGLLTE